MSAHTPGPWHMELRQDGDVEIVGGADDSPLATFYGDDDDPLCWPVTANARLAVAAPELAESLRQTLAVAEHNTVGCCCTRTVPCILCVARALLARIEGKS
jgi:hypothetical protein